MKYLRRFKVCLLTAFLKGFNLISKIKEDECFKKSKNIFFGSCVG